MDKKLDNLIKELKSLIRSEKQVMYILSEIRKKLELNNNNYPTLKMYCSWTLHNDLSWKEAINFLKTIDFNSEESMTKISLETFREELQKFLIDNNLPEEITKDEWFQFRKYFLS